MALCLQNGNVFSGNCRAYFDYYQEQGGNFNLILLCRGSATRTKLINEFPDTIVYDLYSLMGMIAFLKTPVIVISHGRFDHFPFSKMFYQTFVNLWHGIPIKTIGRKFRKIKIHWDYMIVSSQFEARMMKQAFPKRDLEILPLGMPRMDALFNSTNQASPQKKIVLYVPTFRDRGSVRYFPFDDIDLKKLDEYLVQNSIEIVIKPHANDLKSEVLLDINQCSSISIETNREVDLQDLILRSWCVITDYSGVYFDAVAIDKPLIFLPYDIDEYKDQRGFMFDFMENTPGPKIKSQNGLIEYFDSLTQGNDEYVTERKLIRNKFFEFQDGLASARITDLLEKVLEQSKYKT